MNIEKNKNTDRNMYQFCNATDIAMWTSEIDNENKMNFEKNNDSLHISRRGRCTSILN